MPKGNPKNRVARPVKHNGRPQAPICLRISPINPPREFLSNSRASMRQSSLRNPLRNPLTRNYLHDSGGTPNPAVPPTELGCVSRGSDRLTILGFFHKTNNACP